MPHSEAYLFLSTYWWLMFPLGWGALALVQTFLRHRRAARALELIASYAERGAEPPTELLECLRPPKPVNNAWLERPETFWRAGFVLMALAVGFGVLTAMKAHGGDADNFAGMLFVTVTLGALTAASFLSALIGPRGTDKPRAP